MIHTISYVAEARFLDPSITAKVAETSKHVFKDGGNFYVTTATADAFVAEVKAAQGDEAANDAIRQREIAAHRSRFQTFLTGSKRRTSE